VFDLEKNTTSRISHSEGSKPVHKVKVDKNVYVKMRDSVRIAIDIYRPDAKGKFPALLAMSPYGKDVQAIKVPPRPFNMEYVRSEAGDIEFFVTRGYAFVVADCRGTGYSEGRYDICSQKEQEDGYVLVEWIGQQPWCNGNVGMIGISYYALIQFLVAAQQPPHLKALFAHDGWTDLYRDISHHGGIPCVGWLPEWTAIGILSKCRPDHPMPASKTLYSEKELKRRVEKLKSNNVINKHPLLYNVLLFPEYMPLLFDWLVNEEDGPYYWERSAYTKFDKVKVPVCLGSEMHAYPVVMHLPGAFRAWEGINAPKKLVIRPEVPKRPFQEFHDEILRWFDYWLKGINTGIMDEPPIKIWVRGAEEWKIAHEWPLPETKWTKYYLESNGLLTQSQATGEVPPDTFHYKPILPVLETPYPLDPMPEYLSYTTDPLKQDTELIGPIALSLYASISSDDANFIIKIKDIGPDGSECVLSRGWLKASHREVDKKRSKPWQPYHPHTKPTPVVPGQVYEYSIEIRPIANLFRKGHKIQLEIWGCDFPKEAMDLTLSWPTWNHLPNDKETSYKIYHTKMYPSYLLLPMIPR